MRLNRNIKRVISLILIVIGIFTRYWSVIHTGNVIHYQGLWKRCSNVGNGTCINIRANGFLKFFRLYSLFLILGILVISAPFRGSNTGIPKKSLIRFFFYSSIPLGIVWLITNSKIEGTRAIPALSFFLYIIGSFLISRNLN